MAPLGVRGISFRKSVSDSRLRSAPITPIPPGRGQDIVIPGSFEDEKIYGDVIAKEIACFPPEYQGLALGKYRVDAFLAPISCQSADLNCQNSSRSSPLVRVIVLEAKAVC